MSLIAPARVKDKNAAKKAAIVSHVRAGATRKDAAAASGVARSTLYLWMERDSDFSDTLTQAEGECAVLMSTVIYREATRRGGSWRAALEWLKRRRPDEWGDRRQIDLRQLSNAQLLELLAECEPEEGGGDW